MKKIVIGIWYSLPIQLLFLHFKRYQVLLIFWFVLFAVVAGGFMRNFGANSLFLAPEYFDKVTGFSTSFVGFALGVFIMSWNITTFILNSKYIKFLATTAQPFLKYCINNSIIPLVFLIFYFVRGMQFARTQELLSGLQIVWLIVGFALGFMLAVLIAILYFFGADKTIYFTMGDVIDTANNDYKLTVSKNGFSEKNNDFRIDWFLSGRLSLRSPRNVKHYSDTFLDSIFKRHHISAMLAIVMAFLALIGLGFIAEAKLFQLPAAASVITLFAILIAVSGACTIFFGNKTVIVILISYLIVNYLYQKEIIDPRNKAYGLNYIDKSKQPIYSKSALLELASDSNIAKDKANYLTILNNWKANQKQEKPVLFVINVSGGGLRSASFVMNVLQELNARTKGSILKQTLFINGASGGLLGASYFRELYNLQQKGKVINLQDENYVKNISKDLLNPIFSSFVSRDFIGPIHKFTYNNFEYVKDRGFAFEQKFNENTGGILNKSIKDYATDEAKAAIPFMFFNSVITQDARKMIIASHRARFLMQPVHGNNQLNHFDADAVDFNSFFEYQNSSDISILSALRMNATFPYALPNIALPSNPVIDVMDAGLRDNYGQETTLRFLDVFKDWLQANTSKVVMLQIRDRGLEDWEREKQKKQYINFITQPFLVLQNNWYRLQDYYQHDALEYFATSYGNNFKVINWQYEPTVQNHAATLSFHLTKAEKNDIKISLKNSKNTKAFNDFSKLNY